MLLVQAFKCDSGNAESIQALVKELPSTPDVVISNAALGSATVEQYEPDAHKQDLAMLQVRMLLTQSLLVNVVFWLWQYKPKAHKQDLAMLQIRMILTQGLLVIVTF